MSLASLRFLEGFQGEAFRSWLRFHLADHQQIIQAITRQMGTVLPYRAMALMGKTDPFDPTSWSEANEETHQEMTKAVGFSTTDVGLPELEDTLKMKHWVWRHYQEHRIVRNKLGI